MLGALSANNLMPAFRFFDPWAMLENSISPGSPAKAANPAKHSAEPRSATAGLVPVPAEVRGRSAAGAGATSALADRRPTIGGNSIPQCIGLIDFPDEPVLLRDGRRSWRFGQGQHCATDRAVDLIDRAYWYGTVLVADGSELIVVESWLSNLPVETLRDLRRYSVGVIAALRQQSAIRFNSRRGRTTLIGSSQER
jgi:hypothetical protein